MLAKRTQSLKSSFIRDILAITQQPDIISFAGGLPDPELFPSELLKECAEHIQADFGNAIYQYGETCGFHPLREFIAQSLTKPRSKPEQILITSGAQQGIDLSARCLLNPGDGVAIETPSYVGALQVFRANEAQLFDIKSDHQGPDLEQLEQLASQNRIKLFYTITDFNNPTGVSYSEERRIALCNLAQKYKFWILEDAPYSALRYQGEELPTLQSLLPDRVIQLGSFSKIIAPGLRTGWISAPPSIIKNCECLKQVTDLHSSSYDQHLILEFLQRGALPAHLEKLKTAYSQRLEQMAGLLLTHSGEKIKMNKPEGGMFIWITLDPQMDTMALFKRAIEERVAFVPGAAFYSREKVSNDLRLNFSNASNAQINEGVTRLLALIQTESLHCSAA